MVLVVHGDREVKAAADPHERHVVRAQVDNEFGLAERVVTAIVDLIVDPRGA